MGVPMPTQTSRGPTDGGLRWLAPGGGLLGDGLVLSGVIKAGFEATGERFGVVRSQPFSSIFIGHPAVATIASVDMAGATLQTIDYWNSALTGFEMAGPYQRLSRMLFGQVHGDCRPWAPVTSDDQAQLKGLPFSMAPILVGPVSESPRREWPRAKWVELVSRIAAVTSAPIVQAGMVAVSPLPGAFNVAGRLPLRLLLALVMRSQAVVTVDSLMTHAGSMAGVPTVNIYGPQSPGINGYDDQINLYSTGPCLGPCLDGSRDDFKTPCPMAEPCIPGIGTDLVFEAFVQRVLPSIDAGRPLNA